MPTVKYMTRPQNPGQHRSAVMECAGNREGGSSHSSGKDRQGRYGTNFWRKKAFSLTLLREFLGPKKRPLGFSRPEVLNPRLLLTPSPSSRCSPVRSRRTVRRGSGDRSWFGCPQAIKKAAGNAARKKGTNASNMLDSPATPPSSGSQR